MNPINKDAFRSYIVAQGQVEEELLVKHEYMAQYLLLNILDQIWI
jgi:hypothetical protein